MKKAAGSIDAKAKAEAKKERGMTLAKHAAYEKREMQGKGFKCGGVAKRGKR